MPNGLNDEIFESLLKAAVIQNSLNEIDSYPSSEELNKLVISDTCDCKIRKSIRRYWYAQRFAKFMKSTKKAVSFVAILLGISFITLLTSKDVRAACYRAIVQFHEKYIQFDFGASMQGHSKSVELGYIPEGFRKTKDELSDYGFFAKYENNNGESIILYYSLDVASTVDIEHYDISNIEINGSEGKCFTSKDKRFSNIVIWYSDSGYYELISDLEINEIIKIAKNIK